VNFNIVLQNLVLALVSNTKLVNENVNECEA